MECVVHDTPPPPDLLLAFQCQRWNALPDSGGLYEQDFQTLYRMTATLNIYNTVSRVRQLKGKEIHRLTDSERKILRYLMDNKVLFHA